MTDRAPSPDPVFRLLARIAALQEAPGPETADAVAREARAVAGQLRGLQHVVRQVKPQLSGMLEVMGSLLERVKGDIQESDRQTLSALASRIARILAAVEDTGELAGGGLPAAIAGASSVPSHVPGDVEGASSATPASASASGPAPAPPPAVAPVASAPERAAAAPPPRTASAPAASTVESNGVTVLVCDRDTLIVRMLAAVLKRRGYEVLSSSTFGQAFAQATARRPDVLVVDPAGRSGPVVERLTTLAANEALADVPIIVCSATSLGSGSYARSVVEWLPKPIDTQDLLGALERATSSATSKTRVLVVEDNESVALTLTRLLERHGAEVVHARSGLRAVQLSQRTNVDMVVLDVGLPEFDGFTVVDQLRASERTCDLPIMIYTGRDLDDAQRERLTLGRTVFLRKGDASTEDLEMRLVGLLAACGVGNGG